MPRERQEDRLDCISSWIFNSQALALTMAEINSKAGYWGVTELLISQAVLNDCILLSAEVATAGNHNRP